jgi:hypothetical protein
MRASKVVVLWTSKDCSLCQQAKSRDQDASRRLRIKGVIVGCRRAEVHSQQCSDAKTPQFAEQEWNSTVKIPDMTQFRIDEL